MRIRPLFALAFFLLVEAVWLVVVFGSLDRRMADYHTYDTVTVALNSGLNPYALTPIQAQTIAASRWGDISPFVFREPPFVLLNLIPLVQLPPVIGALVWSIESVLAFAVAGLFLSKLKSDRWIDPLVFVGEALFAPVLITVSAGQVNAFLLLSLAMAVWAIENQRSAVAAVAIAFGILIKLLPFALLLYVAWRRGWKVVVGAVLALLALAASSLILIPVQVWEDYVVRSFSLAGAGSVSAYAENESIWTFFARLAPESLVFPLSVIGVIIVLFVLVLVLREQKERQAGVEMSLIISAVMLIAPISWLHLQVVLLVPFAVLFKGLRSAEQLYGDWRYVSALVPYALFDLQAVVWRRFEALPLLSSWGTLALVLLIGVLAWQLMRARENVQLVDPSPAVSMTP